MSSSIAIPQTLATSGALNEKSALVSNRHFIAKKFGVTLAKGEKAKALKDRLLASGVTKDQLKAANREFDGFRKEAYSAYNSINAVFAADPSYRKTMKVWKNKAGAVCATTNYRKERSLETSAVTRMQARIAELEGLLAKQTTATVVS